MVVSDEGRLPLPWLGGALAMALGLVKAHAILLHAAAGDGALQLALSLAQSWLCESSAVETPTLACGHCASCRQVATRAHPDLKVLLPETLQAALGWLGGDAETEAADGAKSRRKPSRQIGIGAVRDAIGWVSTSSSRGRGKVVLIHPADALNPQSANALLKTLEEPPRGARLILTTGDPESLLPTVRSRCQRLRLATPSTAAAMGWLAERGVADAAVLLRAMDGHPLDAAAQSDAGMTARWWNELPAAVARGQASHFSDWPLPKAIDALSKLCHDAMAVTAGAEPRFFDANQLPAVKGLPALVTWRAELARAARHDEHPWNESLLIEALLAAAAPAWKLPAFATLRP